MAASLPRWVSLATLAIAVPVLAGCITTSSTTPLQTTGLIPPLPSLGPDVLSLLDDGGFAIDTPIDVVLLGFEPGVAAALREKLTPEEVAHDVFTFTTTFPPDPSNPTANALTTGGLLPHPVMPRGVFRVVEAPPAVTAAFLAFAQEAKVEGALDANAAEAWLHRALADAGLAFDADTPPFVILHGGEALGEHRWRYTYSHGWLEPVRAFGELHPLLVYDVSAETDPYVVGRPGPLTPAFNAVFGAPEVKDYNFPQEAGGDATVAALEDLVRDAAHYRFLKAAIYPISTKPCHHVTLVLAVHATSVTEALPGYRKADSYVDVPGLQAAFANLTRDEVTVDLKKLVLPVDDPVLDALTRGAGGFATLDALRWHLDQNWEQYVTLQPPCEEYLSLLVFGDPATVGAFGGIGMYDVNTDRRISFSLVADQSRLTQDGPTRGVPFGTNPSRVYNMVNLLYSHETGHLLGQHHPQHLIKTGDPSPQNSAFESVWSVMSYQTVDRTIDFGTLDQAQWLRNRAGYAVAHAMEAGLVEDPAFQAALASLRTYDWTSAHMALEPLLAMEAADGHSHAPGSFHTVGHHDHPWGKA